MPKGEYREISGLECRFAAHFPNHVFLDTIGMTTPLSGYLVIDFTHVLAGPACAYYLGLLGADVIKVESISKGDAIRHRGGTDTASSANGMSTSYLTQGSGKRSIALDLEAQDDMQTMKALLARADIFVENHLPATMERLGLDETVIQREYPELIHCALTGYGRNGPQANAPAYDVNIQAACGIMECTGTAESGPTRTGAPILDYATAMAASMAVLAAIIERQKTGKGAFIDVSMLETGLTLMSSTVTDYLKTGNEPKRRGNLANSRSAGAGSFACRDGMISLGVNEETHFTNLAKVLKRDDWLTDPRFSERPQRQKHATELVEELTSELAKYEASDIELRLQRGGVPAARIRTLAECLASDQVTSRNFIHTDPDTGLSTPTLPFRLNRTKTHAPAGPPPAHGVDTDDILAWLQTPHIKADK